jgi:hypothetical protein
MLGFVGLVWVKKILVFFLVYAGSGSGQTQNIESQI